jgi:hypothetical protein
MLHFYESVSTSFFFGGGAGSGGWTHILTEIVFVTQLSSNGNFSLTNYVSYNKFLFHGQYFALSKPLPRFGYLAS